MDGRSSQFFQNKAIERLMELGLINDQQVHALLASGHQPLRELINNGWVSESDYATTVSQTFAVDLASSEHLPSSGVAGIEDLRSFLHENEALPLSLNEGVLRLAVTDPSSHFVVQVLRAKLGHKIDLCVMQRTQLLDALDSLYPISAASESVKAQSAQSNIDVGVEAALDSDSQLVRDVHRLIQRAVSAHASDIHFESIDSSLRVRFRVHGLLRTVHTFSPDVANQVVARLKLMAKLDVSEKRHAQNGRFRFPADGRIVDLRVSTLPLHNGESIVLRLLEFELSQLALTSLGFAPSVVDQLTLAVHAQQGMLLITGPTGSGKSTTLYALLNHLNQSQLKLVSIEDPVEMKMAGVNQIQVNDEYGLGFSEALRSVLRQDPDVIMVGEIRDAETAQLAAQAALTGHLVLATLHTSTAATAFARLKNLGLPDYLQAATLRTVLAQRLIRVRCEACFSDTAATGKSDKPDCSDCQGSRYAGRRVIAELIPFDSLRMLSEPHAIRLGEPDSETQRPHLKWSEVDWNAQLLNGVSMSDDANELLRLGVTDAAEIYRVLGIVSAQEPA
ncbi:MAG: GspE/PulE family protein [Arenicella sp.]|nr:GspE/PulE family protein [Arenicella sp.]